MSHRHLSIARSRWARLGLALGLLLVVPGRSHAACPGSNGTVPGTAATTYELSAGSETWYVDDRDWIGLEDEDNAGGLWIYRESNSREGLQRGGARVVEARLPVSLYPGPTPVLPPDPNRPVAPGGLTLFPNGFVGGCMCEPILPPDDCTDGAGPADTLIF